MLLTHLWDTDRRWRLRFEKKFKKVVARIQTRNLLRIWCFKQYYCIPYKTTLFYKIKIIISIFRPDQAVIIILYIIYDVWWKVMNMANIFFQLHTGVSSSSSTADTFVEFDSRHFHEELCDSYGLYRFNKGKEKLFDEKEMKRIFSQI